MYILDAARKQSRVNPTKKNRPSSSLLFTPLSLKTVPTHPPYRGSFFFPSLSLAVSPSLCLSLSFAFCLSASLMHIQPRPPTLCLHELIVPISEYTSRSKPKPKCQIIIKT